MDNYDQPEKSILGYTYLDTVRATITALDGQILTSIYYTFVIPSGLFAAAPTVGQYLVTEPLVGHIVAIFLFVSSSLMAFVFSQKIKMLSGLLDSAITIAIEIERNLGISPDLRISENLNNLPLAGPRGTQNRWPFQFAIYIIVDIGNFWHPFLELIAHMQNAGFVQPGEVNCIIAERIEDVIPTLETFARRRQKGMFTPARAEFF